MSTDDLFLLKQNCSKFGIKTFGHSGTYAPVAELDSTSFFGCDLTTTDLPKTELCVLIGTIHVLRQLYLIFNYVKDLHSVYLKLIRLGYPTHLLLRPLSQAFLLRF